MSRLKLCSYLAALLSSLALYVADPSLPLSITDPEQAQIERVTTIYEKIAPFTMESFPILVYQKSEVMNAWFSGEKITITSAIAEKLNDDELAFVIAHELSHFALGHLRDEVEGQEEAIISKEAHADELAVYYTLRAGYDVCKAKGTFEKFRELYGESLLNDHPSNALRLYMIDLPMCH